MRTANYNPDVHHRRSIRLKNYDYSQAGAYFVTVCAWNKECLFGNVVDGEMSLNEFGKITQKHWDTIAGHFGNVDMDTDEFVIMPNHVHGIVILQSDGVGAIHELPLQDAPAIDSRRYRRQMLLPKVIGRFKMNAAKHINEIRETPGTPVWQRNYYEHIIRDDDDLHRIREYIVNNPARWADDEENPGNMKKMNGRGNS